ncbi:hypothetical protein GCM10009504_17320 [Pseudomonas laurentiana]|nr:hypothetical protein GCM10009504_17320 [Pseudomonas laurentiana]
MPAQASVVTGLEQCELIMAARYFTGEEKARCTARVPFLGFGMRPTRYWDADYIKRIV